MEQDPRALYNDELYRQWRDSRSDWDTEARKDIDFYLGNHFTAMIVTGKPIETFFAFVAYLKTPLNLLLS